MKQFSKKTGGGLLSLISHPIAFIVFRMRQTKDRDFKPELVE